MRCGMCENFLFVEEGIRYYNPDEARENEKESLHKGRTCTGLGGPDANLSLCTDIQLLMIASGRCGSVEVNDESGPSLPSNCLLHPPCTSECAYNEMIFDANEFDEYSRIVSECHMEALDTD